MRELEELVKSYEAPTGKRWDAGSQSYEDDATHPSHVSSAPSYAYIEHTRKNTTGDFSYSSKEERDFIGRLVSLSRDCVKELESFNSHSITEMGVICLKFEIYKTVEIKNLLSLETRDFKLIDKYYGVFKGVYRHDMRNSNNVFDSINTITLSFTKIKD
jgi:hypothetical protein